MQRHTFTAFLAAVTFVVAVSIAGCRETSSRISVIVFDVGGVLSKDMIDTKLIDLAQSYNLDADAVLQAKSRYRDRADLGQISDEEFWTQILDHFDVQATSRDAEIDSYLELVDGTLDIAKTLSQRYRTAILSNDSKEMAALRRKKFGFDALFDPIVISADVGVKKPDAMIYRHLLERLGVAASECLFIDNNQDNVDAARAIGMRAVRFETAPQLREALSALGIAVDE